MRGSRDRGAPKRPAPNWRVAKAGAAKTVATERTQRKAVSVWTKLLIAVLVLALLAALAYWRADSGAKRWLSERVAKASRDADELAATWGAKRVARDGEPVAGNAVWDYNALTWVLEPFDAWKALPPANLPTTTLPCDDPFPRGDGFIWVDDVIAKGTKELTSEQQAQFDHYKPLLEHVRDGLQRERCAWRDPSLADSSGAYNWSVTALKETDRLLSLAAYMADNRRALRLSVEHVAFAHDVGRMPSLIGAMLGCAILNGGLDSVARAAKHVDSAAALRQALASLKRSELPDYAAYARADLDFSSQLMATAGTDGLEGGGLGVVSATRVFHAWAWEDLDDFHQRVVAAWERDDRAEIAALGVEATESWNPLAAMTYFDGTAAADKLHAARQRQRVVCCMLAARVHALEKGEAATKLTQLIPYLGGAPASWTESEFDDVEDAWLKQRSSSTSKPAER